MLKMISLNLYGYLVVQSPNYHANLEKTIGDLPNVSVVFAVGQMLDLKYLQFNLILKDPLQILPLKEYVYSFVL